MSRFTSKSSIRQQFREITGSSNATATDYLESCNYDLQQAIETYLNKNKEKAKGQRKTDPKLLSIYDQYKDPENEGVIDINGTLKYLEDLNIDPEDMISLTLSFFLESPSMGIFTREAFLSRWSNEKIHSLSQMKTFINDYHNNSILKDEEIFTKLYNFTFGFLMENENQKLLGYELAVDYWRLILLNDRADDENGKMIKERLNQWCTFVNEEYKRNISKDSWEMFYLFYKDILTKDPKNFTDYDEMSAWPSIIDEFIEYLRENELLSN